MFALNYVHLSYSWIIFIGQCGVCFPNRFEAAGHFIGTQDAQRKTTLCSEKKSCTFLNHGWCKKTHFSFGLALPGLLPLIHRLSVIPCCTVRGGISVTPTNNFLKLMLPPFLKLNKEAPAIPWEINGVIFFLILHIYKLWLSYSIHSLDVNDQV